MSEILIVDTSRCGSLPPQVGGKLNGYLVMKVDEILWCRKALGNIIVLAQWWGEAEVVTFRPVNVKSLTNRSHEETIYFYKVMTNVKLLECYLANCETLDLIVIDEGLKTPIGSVTLHNLPLIIQENPYQSYFPLINSFGNRIADLHVCFNLKLFQCASWPTETSKHSTSDDISAENKMGLYRVAKVDMKHSKSNQAKKHKHCKIKQCSKHPNSTTNQSKTILSPVRENVSEPALPIREVIPDDTISQILARGQRLRNAMVKSVLEDGVELATLQSDSAGTVLAPNTSNKTAQIQNCSTKPETRVLEYLLGKDLDSKEEALALDALCRMSPVASFVEIAQHVFSDEINSKVSVNVESRTMPCQSSDKGIETSKGTATSLGVDTLSSYDSDDENLWEYVQKKRPSLQAEVSTHTLKSHNVEPQRKLSDKTELFNRAKFLRVSVQRVSLNFAGLQRVLVCAGAPSRPGNNPSAPPGVVYFVEYEVPRPLSASTSVMKDARVRPWATKLQRFCSKKQIGRVVHFDAHSVHALACNKPAFHEILEYSSLMFRVYSRYLNQRLPALVGEADLPLASLLDPSSSSRIHELSIMSRLGASRCRAPLGMLRVKLELSSDRTHFGDHALRPSDGDDSTEEENGTSAKEVTSSSEPSDQTDGRGTKIEGCRSESAAKGKSTGQDGKREKAKKESAVSVETEAKKVILLHGLLHVSEGRGFSPAGSYLVCRAFWREDVMSSEVCWHTKRPYYGFHELMPMLLTPDLLQRSHNNFLVTELWNQHSLLGLAKLPLNQFYVAYRDPLVAEQLLLNKYPVVSVDGWVNVVNPSNRQFIGQLNVVLALGTEDQIQLLETTRGFRDAVFAPTLPDQPPPSLVRDPPVEPPLWQVAAMHKYDLEPQDYCEPLYNMAKPAVGSERSSFRAVESSPNINPSQLSYNPSHSIENCYRAPQMSNFQPSNVPKLHPMPQNVDSAMRAQGYLQRINKHSNELSNRNVTGGLMEPIREVEPLDLSLTNERIQYIAKSLSRETQIEGRLLQERMKYSDHSSLSSSETYMPKEVTFAGAALQDRNFSSSRDFNPISRNHLEEFQHCSDPIHESNNSRTHATSHRKVTPLTKDDHREQYTKSQVALDMEVRPGRSKNEEKLKENDKEINNFLDLVQDLNTRNDRSHFPESSFTKQANMVQVLDTNMSESTFKNQTNRPDTVQVNVQVADSLATHGRNLAEPLRMDGGIEFNLEDKQDSGVSIPCHSAVSQRYSNDDAVCQSRENKNIATSQLANEDQHPVSNIVSNLELGNSLRYQSKKKCASNDISVLNKDHIQLKDDFCARERLRKPPDPVLIIADVAKELAVASVTTQTERGQIRDSFRARVEVVSALHLPLVRQARQHREPSCYVTFQTDQESGSKFMATQVVLRDVSPTWEWACETKLPVQLLQNDTKRLIFKVWHHVDGIAGPPDTIRDAVLGFAAVDLSVLLFGLPWVAGWFNVTDFTGRCKGQIKINVTPLENMMRFANRGTAAGHLSRGYPNFKPNIIVPIPNSSSSCSISYVINQPSDGVLSSSNNKTDIFGVVCQNDILYEMGEDANEDLCHPQTASRIMPVSGQLPTTVEHSWRGKFSTVGKMHQTCEAGMAGQTNDQTKTLLQQHPLNQPTANKDPGALFDDEFADASSSFLSRALKQKLSELDEITHRLKRRLSSVTNEDGVSVLYNPWLEERPQSFSPLDACCVYEVPHSTSVSSNVASHSLNQVVKSEDTNPRQTEMENIVRDRHLSTSHTQQNQHREVINGAVLPLSTTRIGGVNTNKVGALEEYNTDNLQKEVASLHIDPNQEECVEDFDALTEYFMHLAAKEIELENVFNPLLFQHLVASYSDGERVPHRKVLEPRMPTHNSTRHLTDTVNLNEKEILSRSGRYHFRDSDHTVTSRADHVVSRSSKDIDVEVSTHSKDVHAIPTEDRHSHGISKSNGGKVLYSHELGERHSLASRVNSGSYHSRDQVMTSKADCVQSSDNILGNRDQHNSEDVLVLRRDDRDTFLDSDDVRQHFADNAVLSQATKSCMLSSVDDNVSRINRGREMQSHEIQHHSKDTIVQQGDSVKGVGEIEYCFKDGSLMRGQDSDGHVDLGVGRGTIEPLRIEGECEKIREVKDASRREETRNVTTNIYSADIGLPDTATSAHTQELNEDYFQLTLGKDYSSSFISLDRNYDLVRSTPSGISTEGNELEVIDEIAAKCGGNSECTGHVLMQKRTNTKGVESVVNVAGLSRDVSVKSSSSELDINVSDDSISNSSAIDVRRQAPDGGNPTEEGVTNSRKPLENKDKTSQNSQQESCDSESNPTSLSLQQQHNHQQKWPVMDQAEIQRIARIFNPHYKNNDLWCKDSW